MSINWHSLMQMKEPEVAARWPNTRRWFAQGFRLSPRHHAEGMIGLESLNQTIRLNVLNGDFENQDTRSVFA